VHAVGQPLALGGLLVVQRDVEALDLRHRARAVTPCGFGWRGGRLGRADLDQVVDELRVGGDQHRRVEQRRT
jgi:hypothetical protein